jgi:probable rRNA maturation factor
MTSTDQPETAPAIDVVVQSRLWQAAPDSEKVLRRAIAAAAMALSINAPALAIMLSDDSAIRLLNRNWCGIDASTNVLSFPSKPLQVRGAPPAPLGDIVIAYETTTAEAAAEGKPFLDHLAHLGVHGFLHLVGHDHRSEREAEAMEALERKILAQLDIPDPYRARDTAG